MRDDWRERDRTSADMKFPTFSRRLTRANWRLRADEKAFTSSSADVGSVEPTRVIKTAHNSWYTTAENEISRPKKNCSRNVVNTVYRYVTCLEQVSFQLQIVEYIVKAREAITRVIRQNEMDHRFLFNFRVFLGNRVALDCF